MFVPLFIVPALLTALLIAVIVIVLIGLHAKDMRELAEREAKFGEGQTERATLWRKAADTWRFKAQQSSCRATNAEREAAQAKRDYDAVNAKFERMTTRKQGKGGRFVANEYPDDQISFGS